jgi:hypothetical protein
MISTLILNFPKFWFVMHVVDTQMLQRKLSAIPAPGTLAFLKSSHTTTFLSMLQTIHGVAEKKSLCECGC